MMDFDHNILDNIKNISPQHFKFPIYTDLVWILFCQTQPHLVFTKTEHSIHSIYDKLNKQSLFTDKCL